ncbi:protein of unknown function (plasmid) [Caballeronia sp. S22]
MTDVTPGSINALEANLRNAEA